MMEDIAFKLFLGLYLISCTAGCVGILMIIYMMVTHPGKEARHAR